jgi:hypothetical protein
MRETSVMLTLLLLLSCQSNDGKKSNQILNDKVKSVDTIYNEEQWYHFKKKIYIKDTACINQTQRANTDISKDLIILNRAFIRFSKNYTNGIDENLLRKLLSNKKIFLDTTISPYGADCLSSPDFNKYCYEEVMINEINKKFGRKFLDSVKDVVEKKYVKTHPHKIYSWNEIDLGSSPINYEDAFFTNFKYPKQYIPRKEKTYSYTNADFILHQDGRITNLVVSSTFQNPTNLKHKLYFESHVANYIRKSQFHPATSAGIAVKSEKSLTFFHK